MPAACSAEAVFLPKPIQILTALLVSCVVAIAQSALREKVGEGTYVMLVNGAPVPGSEQAWTLWRLRDGGFDLENEYQLSGDPALELLEALGPKHLDPSLRRTLQGKSLQTGFRMHLSAANRVETLKVNGKAIADGKPLTLADCRITNAEASCKGREVKAKYKISETQKFLYSFPSPPLFRSLLPQATPAVGQTLNHELVLLTLAENQLRLDPGTASVTYNGEDTVTLAGDKFRLHKYTIAVRSPGEPIDVVVWATPKGVILGMDSSHQPGSRLALKNFKKYSDF